MNLSEINWDYNAAGTWPLQVKAAVILIVCCLVAGGGVYYFTLDQLTELDKLEKTELTLRADFEKKQQKAVNLPAYREQLQQIEGLLGDMIKQMPTKAEVAALLNEISQIALESGLDNRLFEPSEQVRKDFYFELPYKIEMVGKYEELGLFVSGLASLPRIVTVHNVDISSMKGKDNEMRMKMRAIVKTYNEASDDGK